MMSDSPKIKHGHDTKNTWAESLESSVSALETKNLPNARIEAQWILEIASGYGREELVSNLNTEASILGAKHLNKILNRRLSGEPIQYALGSWSFRQLDLLVDSRVLIPRPETEILVDVAHGYLGKCDRDAPLRVCDLGTGSGAIGLSIAQERNDVEVYLVDNSSDALKVASANLAGLGNHAVKVKVFESNWLDQLPDELKNSFQLIVSNPPYIASGEELPPEVTNYEPHQALFAGERGTEHVESILSSAPAWLSAGGTVILEMAPHQTDYAAEIAIGQGYSDVKITDDLTGRKRIVSCTCRD